MVPQTRHVDDLGFAVLSPDEQLLATGSWDKTLKIWDVRTRTILRSFRTDFGKPGEARLTGLTGHAKLVTTLAFDGNELLSGSADGTVRTWDLATGKQVDHIKVHEPSAGGVWLTAVSVLRDRRVVIGLGKVKLSDGEYRTDNQLILSSARPRKLAFASSRDDIAGRDGDYGLFCFFGTVCNPLSHRCEKAMAITQVEPTDRRRLGAEGSGRRQRRRARSRRCNGRWPSRARPSSSRRQTASRFVRAARRERRRTPERRRRSPRPFGLPRRLLVYRWDRCAALRGRLHRRRERRRRRLLLPVRACWRALHLLRSRTAHGCSCVVLVARGELSYERADFRNGLFTQAILNALTGTAADTDRDGAISPIELRSFVAGEVERASPGLQTPVVDRDNATAKITLPLVPAASPIAAPFN